MGLVHIGENNIRTLIGKMAADRQPDPVGGAGHNGSFT
jgi:hypothetical protein